MEDKFKKALKLLQNAFDELNKLPKLEYPELTEEMNDMLWTFDGLEECKEILNKSQEEQDILYYNKKITEYRNEIISNEKYLTFLN